MLLVDTSVWIDHLRYGNDTLAELLDSEEVLCHRLIIGELACGNIQNRPEVLEMLKALPAGFKASHDEVMKLIDDKELMGKGLGYVDVSLIASALLSQARLWTLDARLQRTASGMGLTPD